MLFTSLTCLASLTLAGIAAWRVGGVVGNGLLLGVFAAVGITSLGLAYQRQVLRSRPNLAVGVLGLFLLVKLFTLGGLGVLLVTWRPAAERADLEATLLSFAAASVAVLLVGTVENARWLKQRRPSPPPEGTRAAGAARPAAPSHSRPVTDPRGQAV